jgi:hypothetical protein
MRLFVRSGSLTRNHPARLCASSFECFTAQEWTIRYIFRTRCFGSQLKFGDATYPVGTKIILQAVTGWPRRPNANTVTSARQARPQYSEACRSNSRRGIMINICPRPLLVAASVVALTSGLFAGSGVAAEVVVRGVEGRPLDEVRPAPTFFRPDLSIITL